MRDIMSRSMGWIQHNFLANNNFTSRMHYDWSTKTFIKIYNHGNVLKHTSQSDILLQH